MKYSLSVNQIAAYSLGLEGKVDLIDLCLFDSFKSFANSKRCEKRIDEGGIWFWISYDEIIKEVPFAGIKTKDGVYRRMLKLRDARIIIFHPDNQKLGKAFFQWGENYDAMERKDWAGPTDERPYPLRMKDRTPTDEKPYNQYTNQTTHTKRGVVSEKETTSTLPESDYVTNPNAPAHDSKLNPAVSAPTKRTAYPEDFEAFWKRYAHPEGSKKTAASRWAHLTAKEKTAALENLTAHIRATTTEKGKTKPGAIFKPYRCAAEVYISQARWEAYAEKERLSNPDSENDPYAEWSEMYAQYLRSCEAHWPDVLAQCAHLSKKEFATFKGGNYMKGIGRVGVEMQGNRLKKCHTAYNEQTPSATKYGTVWAYFLNYMEDQMIQMFTI